MRYFLELSYKGEPFHGWQTQPHDVSVQQTIEHALELLLGVVTPIVGAGRTDAGVNAATMFAHFDTDRPIADVATFLRSLNSICGRDIAIRAVHPVRADAHARFDATSRTYYYHVHTVKSPFLYPLSWRAPADLDFEMMNRAAAMLLEVSDFTSFAKLHSDAKTNICRVTRAEWVRLDSERWVFIITADRFLRNMVRAIVGTLVDVGRHKLSLNRFADIIASKNRCEAGTSMPPHPLFLQDVTYPADLFI